MNELITCEELCLRLKLKRQTIYNMIYRKEFVKNKHYFKPTNGILLFDWDAIKEWLRGTDSNKDGIGNKSEKKSDSDSSQETDESIQPSSRINI